MVRQGWVLYETAGVSVVWYSRGGCCMRRQGWVLYGTAGVGVVWYGKGGCCMVRQGWVLYETAGVGVVWYSRGGCCMGRQGWVLYGTAGVGVSSNIWEEHSTYSVHLCNSFRNVTKTLLVCGMLIPTLHLGQWWRQAAGIHLGCFVLIAIST